VLTNDASPLSRVIDVLNKNTATLDSLFIDKVRTLSAISFPFYFYHGFQLIVLTAVTNITRRPKVSVLGWIRRGWIRLGGEGPEAKRGLALEQPMGYSHCHVSCGQSQSKLWSMVRTQQKFWNFVLKLHVLIHPDSDTKFSLTVDWISCGSLQSSQCRIVANCLSEVN